MAKNSYRKIVIVNQASNYLTIGFANAFVERFETVALITGSIHVQGPQLKETVDVCPINKWVERPVRKKFASYVRACLRIYLLLITRYRGYEVFFVSLPPMAYLLSAILPQRCSIVVWDVYPDVFKITGMKTTHPVYRLWAMINRHVFKSAYRLFTIGNRMADLLEFYVERRKICVQPIWSIFQENARVSKDVNPFIAEHRLHDKFIIQYSGNIGLTHKVEVMIDLAERMKNHPGILFQIIGRGPRVPVLYKMVKEKRLPNCQFLPFQSDEMFPYSLSAADVGVVILDEQASKGSVPSKSYNLMSYGIPSLYIAASDSELCDYASKYGHAFCCSEENLDKAAEFILTLFRDSGEWKRMSGNAVKASADFRCGNAHKFVELYLA